MEQRPLAERVTAVSTLDDPTRRSLFEYVSRRGEPVGRDEAAEALGLARSTAAFHLDRLADEGLLAVEFRRLTGRTGPGSGRPSKLYTKAAGEVVVSVPERRYDFAARILLEGIEESARTGRPVGETLSDVAVAVGRTLGEGVASLEELLDRHGFEPRREDDGTVVLGNCPFHRLAQEHTNTVCHLNLQLLSGAAEASKDVRYSLLLDPQPGRCCVRLVPAGPHREATQPGA